MINGKIWNDTNGNFINAHSGGILKYKDTYYWYGEDKTEGWQGRLAYYGVHCYSSKDLMNWKDEGIVLKCVEDCNSPIRRGGRIERPKVIYNDLTKKFVMWFHSTDENHTIAKSGVAIADNPTGPFEFLFAKWANANSWPINVTLADKNIETAQWTSDQENLQALNSQNSEIVHYNLLGAHFERGQMARDMTLFKDEDGTAYHIYASESNSTLHIAKLTQDYLEHTGEYKRVFIHRWMEAPAMFKREGKYYLLMSGCTGWDPNPSRAAVADSIFGDWKEYKNPCIGINPTNGKGPETSFGCQSTYVLHLPEQNRYVAMFDEWRSANFIDSRYVWLDIEFDKESFVINWSDEIEF